MAPLDPDELFGHLAAVHDLLDRHGLWHAAAWGTLLGAVREGDVIAGDDDFDLLLHHADRDALAALAPAFAEAGYTLRERRRSAADLAMGAVDDFWDGSFSVAVDGRRVGDLLLPLPCRDGVLRRVDPERDVYWAPWESFPAWFVEEDAPVRVRDLTLRGPREPERWLARVYGAGWRTPSGDQGHRIPPSLHAELAWCRARGSDPVRWAGAAKWPRTLAGAGPRGTAERTRDHGGSPWWRDLDELLRFY